MAIEFRTEFDPDYRHCVEVAPGIRRVVADNPSKYTAWGTGTYVIGRGEVAIVDPGPLLDSHIDAVLAAVDGERVTHVLITHTHADHSPATEAIVAATGATTYGFGPHPEAAETEADEHGEEQSDRLFTPDVAVRDGDLVVGPAGPDGFTIECLHTPGHISNHLCFADVGRSALFTGDHVMGWSTTVISPPDGSITDYMANLERLLDRDESTYYPTHGPPIVEPHIYVQQLIDHRRERERQILGQLAAAEGSGRNVEELVEVLYADVRPELHAAAGRSVNAHLIALAGAGSVTELDDGRWRLR